MSKMMVLATVLAFALSAYAENFRETSLLPHKIQLITSEERS